jgi:hypothetical protein
VVFEREKGEGGSFQDEGSANCVVKRLQSRSVVKGVVHVGIEIGSRVNGLALNCLVCMVTSKVWLAAPCSLSLSN